MSGHYNSIYNKLEEEQTKNIKRKLLGIIDRASDDDIKFLFKVADNLKGYKQFEMFVKNVIGKELK